MIENKLTLHELTRVLRPFLRLEPLESIVPTLQDALGLSVKDRHDLPCQTKVLLTFDGYRVDIRDLRPITSAAASVIIQFIAKAKWWHGIFRDQNADLVRTLQQICRAEIADLCFARFEKTASGGQFTGDEGGRTLVFLHDSFAFNSDWQAGYDISPLLISPDCHHGNCFIEFQFNGAAYERLGDKTVLRDDWFEHAFSVSAGIDQEARRRLGLD